MGASYIKQAQLAAGHCKPAALSQVSGDGGLLSFFSSFHQKLWCKWGTSAMLRSRIEGDAA